MTFDCPMSTNERSTLRNNVAIKDKERSIGVEFILCTLRHAQIMRFITEIPSTPQFFEVLQQEGKRLKKKN